MAGERYVEITSQDMACALGPAGFVKANERGAKEEIYFRDIDNHFGIKIFTSVHLDTGTSRAVGDDAIRLVLWDKVADKPVAKADKRVFRTKNAIPNMMERARELWRVVQNSPRCVCGGLLEEKKGVSKKTNRPYHFFSCSRWWKDSEAYCGKTVNA